MIWTVVATQAVLLVALALVAWSARRAIAEAERARAEDERLAALGNLAAGIAHEIRNPLNTIGLTCRYLERYVVQACEKPGCRAEFNRNFEIVASEVGRLSRTLDDFLLLARPAELDLSECDLDAVADDALALFSRELEEAGIRLERRRGGDLLAAADRDRMLQVFTNIIKNSVQAMGEGGTLSVTSAQANGRASVAFADTGPGISPDLLHRIFEPYYSTKRSGLGLGLSLSKKIVTAHGGSIDVASQPGGGTVFTVILPSPPRGAEGGEHG
jgi:two-component system sensor histidine kinase HydH